MAVQENVDCKTLPNTLTQPALVSNIISNITAGSQPVVSLIPASNGGSNGDAKIKPVFPQIAQTKFIQTLPVGGGNSSQAPVFRIIKNPADTSSISAANVIKASFASPIKVINLPSGSKLLSRPTGKLKVGDTITIQKPISGGNNPTSQKGTIQTMHLASTPAKLVTVVASTQVPSLTNPTNSNCVSQISSMSLSSSLAQHMSPAKLTTISPSWAQSPHKRSAVFCEATPPSDSKRRRAITSSEKGSKGLRHFAMLVCEKVKKKVTTTYNEVADELVAEYADAQKHVSDQYDQKNIRRRVYDALNVLMAMDIIYKDKKDIHWVGLPTNSAQEVVSLQKDKEKREQRIQQKTLQLQELILQQIAFKNLVQRNKRIQQTQGLPGDNSSIQLPFIIVNTSKNTVIDCSISNDKYEYMFNFDNTFEIHDDIEVLKRMGMAYGLEAGNCTPENLKTAQTLVPPVLKPYLREMAGCRREGTLGQSTTAYSAHDAPRILPASELMNVGNECEATTVFDDDMIKIEPDTKIGACFTTTRNPDADDHEVAMVIQRTPGCGISNNPFSSSSRSSSGLHSGMLSLTPGSSSNNGMESDVDSCDSPQLDVVDS